MIQAASRFIFQDPWMMVPTGAILALTIIAANSLADVLAGGTAMPPPLVATAPQEEQDARRPRSLRPLSPTTFLPASVVDNEVAGGIPDDR